MKLQQLRYFAAVYEMGSFSAAAEKVNATQSGLSMHVSQIEKRYDVLLFTRSSSGVTPTEAGRAFYLEAVKVLSSARQAEDRLKTLSGAVVGHLHIGLMPTFTRSVLTAVLLRMGTEYPEVRVSISEAYSGALADEVAEGRLEFAVVPASFDLNEGLESRAMGEDQECLVYARDRVLPVHDGGIRLREIDHLKLVVPGPTNARRQRIETYLSVNGIKLADKLELDTMHGTLDLVANSDWLSILPGILCLPDLDGDRRKVVPLADPPLSVNYMLIHARKQPLSLAAQAFVNVLQEELNSSLEIPPLSRGT
ncbi:LysR family transcriptional regulator [Primorskyibacter sedentarius]|uniref:LysR family transcriptional regulator n=1 Tax=Primorskyibacter sedentarius TaxID=745311 RepID=A0A4R3JGT7_9RHOB|nr:LysR family transcriptional regulator [Primorskyibacter sedentarius]TCS64446.1 LysR family transcriptional regulator [Primorskyibacter sedentarius]